MPTSSRSSVSSTSSDPVAVALDGDIAALRDGLPTWTHLTLEQRSRLLERVRASVVACAQEWAEQAALIKGLDGRHPQGNAHDAHSCPSSRIRRVSLRSSTDNTSKAGAPLRATARTLSPVLGIGPE